MIPVQDDFTGLARLHGFEAFGEFGVVQAVSDYGADIESALQHHRHLIPGLVHFAAVDAVNCEHIEDDLSPVDGDIGGGDAEHGNFSAVGHVVQHAAEGVSITGHFQSHIEAFGHPQFALHVFEFFGANIDSASSAHATCQFQTPWIDIGDDHEASAGMSYNGGGHQADRASTRDQDVFTKHGEGECCVNRITERIKDGGDVAIDTVMVMPDIGHGQCDIFSEGTRTIDADTLSFGAEVSATGETVAAASADHVAFTADNVAGMEVRHVGSDFDDFTDKFVSDDHGNGDGALSPRVPFVNMHVRTADAGSVDFDQYVIEADFGFRNVFQPEPFFCVAFDEGLHLCFFPEFQRFLNILDNVYGIVHGRMFGLQEESSSILKSGNGERMKSGRSANDAVQSAASAEDVSRHVCRRIHQLRRDRGWSLDVLSRASGVSRSMLSQIEREQANPTLAVTVKIAGALGMSMAELVEQSAVAPGIEVIRADDRSHIFRSDQNCSIRTLSPLHLEKDVEFYEVLLNPGGALRSAPHFEGTREFLTVQKGRVVVVSDTETTELNRADSASYRADVAHEIRNPGKSEALVFLVVIYQ